jgi:hypothetical protein
MQQHVYCGRYLLEAQDVGVGVHHHLTDALSQSRIVHLIARLMRISLRPRPSLKMYQGSTAVAVE